MLLWPGIKNWKPIRLSPTSWDERGSFSLWGCPPSIGWEIFEVFEIKDWRRALLCFAQGYSHISLLISITGSWSEDLILQMKIMRLREVQNFCKVTELTNSGIGTQIQVSSIQKPIALKTPPTISAHKRIWEGGNLKRFTIFTEVWCGPC